MLLFQLWRMNSWIYEWCHVCSGWFNYKFEIVTSIANGTDRGYNSETRRKGKMMPPILYNIRGIDVPTIMDRDAVMSNRRWIGTTTEAVVVSDSRAIDHALVWLFMGIQVQIPTRPSADRHTQTPHRRLINWWWSFRFPFLFGNFRKPECVARTTPGLNEPSLKVLK